MRLVRRFAQAIMLLAMFAFYSSATEIKAAPLPVDDACRSDYCVDNYWWENWDCTSGGGWECGWDCYQGPDACWFTFDCCYAN